MFNSVRHIGHLSGQLLAHMLMLSYPAHFSSITLVGISMGAQVVKSCIQELHQFGAHKVVNEIYFLDGAVSFSHNEYLIFSSVMY